MGLGGEVACSTAVIVVGFDRSLTGIVIDLPALIVTVFVPRVVRPDLMASFTLHGFAALHLTPTLT